MNAQHTPGPWEVVAGDDYFIEAEAYPKEYPHHFKSDDLGPALCLVGNRTTDFGESNARLIAAAPELLNALDEVLSQLFAHQLPDAVYRRARAAIAHAQGVPNDLE